jgi:AcrR family transcriptional regulator
MIPYRTGAGAAGTRAAILSAARDLITAAPSTMPSVGAVAGRARVSRLSVYHHFGSRSGLFDALAAEVRTETRESGLAQVGGSPVEELNARIGSACERWAVNPALFRALAGVTGGGPPGADRELAERLAAGDHLRLGCSIREAEDVIGLVSSFAAFDRLHRDGRRSAAAVADILERMSSCILTSPS